MGKASGDVPPFGVALKRHRLAAGLTHEALAERAAVSARMISDLERGVSRAPRRRSLALLANALALTHDQRAVLDAATRTGVPIFQPGSPTDRLPAQLTSFVGREHETAAIRKLLRRHDVRLVTLTGAGGAGKTRLAIRVAENLRAEFADGTCFVALAPVADADDIIATVAAALGVEPVEGFPLEALVANYLRPRQVLLLVDNHEHLLRGAPVLARLLAGCPRVKALVTSRAALRLSGEQEFSVAPLPVPDLRYLPSVEELIQCAAVALFVDRAARVRPHFALTADNAASVAAICVRVDGLPLAIELAAARVKLLPPRALFGQIEGPGGPLRLLTGGARDLPARQQTLRDTIAWSYELLTSDERQLLRQLAVFVGGCTFDAAEAVCRGSGSWAGGPGQPGGIRPPNPGRGPVASEVLDGLASLADKSLLRQEEGPDGEPRFVMLEVIREFALDQFPSADEEAEARKRHARYFLAMVEASGPVLLHRFDALQASAREAGIPVARDRVTLAAEQDNIRAALRWLVEFG